jgi:hypothetical protein
MEVSTMVSGKKIGILVLGLGVLVFLAGTTACQKKATEGEAGEDLQEAAGEFEGLVKTAFGKYLYLDTAQGFDIALQGFDAASLVGKDLRVRGELLQDKPSIFRADAVDVKGDGDVLERLHPVRRARSRGFRRHQDPGDFPGIEHLGSQ